MHDEPDRSRPARAALSRTLDEARARARLDQTQLAKKAKLSRTTVSKALSPRGPVPSVDTVTALARTLMLPVDETLELRRTAAGQTDTAAADVPGPGRLIEEWEPHELEVHPAGLVPNTSSADRMRALPGYVRREHDAVLDNAVAAAAKGRSGIVVLVGSSSTGKTRACWQAVQPLTTAEKQWRLWHPFDPTRAEAAFKDLHRVGPRTVVWLNEAQHYLGDPNFGEQIAAALHQLLIDKERSPVLVLGTLWPEYERQYSAMPSTSGQDSHSRVRELISGHTLAIPDTFDPSAMAAAAGLAEAGDRLLADALTRTRSTGRVAQELAGGPQLLERYEHGSPGAKAVLEAAMDARRLGVGLHLPQAFLTDAATDYLSQTDYDQLTEDWAETAFAELAELVHGKQAPLRRTLPRPVRRSPLPPTAGALPTPRSSTGPLFRLADYLEQHGRITRRRLCPPGSFWHAAHRRLTRPDDLKCLADAAAIRHRLLWAHHLHQRAAEAGNAEALVDLAVIREKAGDRAGAEVLARKVAGAGDAGGLLRLAYLRETAGDRNGAEAIYREAIDAGDTTALYSLAIMREEAGDREGAEALASQAADLHNPGPLIKLASMREEAGDREGAEGLLRQLADIGSTADLAKLAVARERTGDRETAEALARYAAEAGDTEALVDLAVMRERAGDRVSAEALARELIDFDDTEALVRLAGVRKEAGNLKDAQILLQQAADAGSAFALHQLATMREETGDLEGAEAFLWQASDAGSGRALVDLAVMRERAGNRDGAEALARELAETGNSSALAQLAVMRELAGDRASAEALAADVTGTGRTETLVALAVMREKAGDLEDAQALLRLAADAGGTSALVRLAVMRERAGDRESAEKLAQKVADAGSSSALLQLAALREEAGDLEGTEDLLRQVANVGHPISTSLILTLRRSPESSFSFNRRWPYGLDPDGTPTVPWP